MKLKLDENLGHREAELLSSAGHDVRTVFGQRLCSSPDRELARHCAAEKRCLVTLDLDFANPIVFQPSDYCGLAVLRLPNRPGPEDMSDVLRTLGVALQREPIEGQLWVIQRGRVRQYRPEGETADGVEDELLP